MHPTASSTALPAVPPDDAAERFGRPEHGWRLALYRVIFESDTRVGRAFDVALLWLIVGSVVVVVLDSVESIGGRAGRVFDALEWGCTTSDCSSCPNTFANYSTTCLVCQDLVSCLRSSFQGNYIRNRSH